MKTKTSADGAPNNPVKCSLSAIWNNPCRAKEVTREKAIVNDCWNHSFGSEYVETKKKLDMRRNRKSKHAPVLVQVGRRSKGFHSARASAWLMSTA
mmetsp:Transcript_34053/g.65885  ORF Transcript_34053/g.65885 Transcript_34053/m.65885 type:complete len:96 (-) Transcript_34053:260-547(-)